VTLKSFVDVSANYISFAILAASAIVANFLIAAFWSVSALGSFNQVMAVYIVVAQLSVMGQQNAMLNAATQFENDDDHVSDSLWTAFSISLATSTVAAGLIVVLSEPISKLLDSPGVSTGLRQVSAALVFSAIVKISMQTLNGLGLIRSYAIVQAARPVFLLTALLCFAAADVPSLWLPSIVTIAEAVTVLVAVPLLGIRRLPKLGRMIKNTSAMLNFGVRSAPAGLLGELNSRVDYFILGIFASDRMVGVYTFASSLAEGIFLATVIMRILVTSKLSELIRRRDMLLFKEFARVWKIRSGIFALCAYLAVLGVYWIAPQFVSMPDQLQQSVQYFAIIGFGVVLASPYAPFGNLLLLANRPGLHSLYFMGVVICNVIGNFLLTPLYGAYGTAVATLFAYLLSAVWLSGISRRVIRLPL
jgi:O-antigen/teichoic acid export membrane protein